MDAETRAHLFEPFFTTKPQGKGTGLGLATVYGIVHQSGGSIAVDSAPRRGARFQIYLPRVAEAPEAAGPARAVVAPTPGSETVLVAEDEQLVRLLVRRVLEQAGYTVLAAPGGADALQLAAHYPGRIDLLLTDVVMPEMSGRELMRRLAEQRPATRVLYMSGYSDDAVAQHGVLDPGIALIQKPFTPEALARKVREVLDAPR
jgi:CheY-like chemotaxis protein